MTAPPLPAGSSKRLVAVVIGVVVLLAGTYGGGMCRTSTSLVEQQAEKREAAVRIRETAKATCEQKLYRECLRIYDEAKRFDPPGDLEPEVQEARRGALAALEAGAGSAGADASSPPPPAE